MNKQAGALVHRSIRQTGIPTADSHFRQNKKSIVREYMTSKETK